jgi:hypothetical protein
VTEDLVGTIMVRATADGLVDDHPLVEAAERLKRALAESRGYLEAGGPVPHPAAMRVLGCWARARRLWSEYTGEPLI